MAAATCSASTLISGCHTARTLCSTPALAPAVLLQALRQLQVARTVNRAGYVSVQRFYLYAERGLARQRVSVWLYDGRLHLAYQQALLAQYTYRGERRGQRLREVDPHPQLYRTAYASPQLELWELDDAQWRKVMEHPPYQRRLAPAPERHVQQLLWPDTYIRTD